MSRTKHYLMSNNLLPEYEEKEVSNLKNQKVIVDEALETVRHEIEKARNVLEETANYVDMLENEIKDLNHLAYQINEDYNQIELSEKNVGYKEVIKLVNQVSTSLYELVYDKGIRKEIKITIQVTKD